MQYNYVETFYLEAPTKEDPDTIVMGFAAQTEQGEGPVEIVRVRLTGDVTYFDEENSLEMPQAEDFLQQFAAYLGYRVVKDEVE